jgi:hypothetical protein
MFYKKYIGIFMIVITSGCAGYTNYQTAEVVGKGKFGLGCHITCMSIKDDNRNVVLPIIGIMARAGLTESWDLGATYCTPFLSLTLETKYQFLHCEENFLSAAANLGIGVTGEAFVIGYGGVILSKKIGRVEPYVSYRYEVLGVYDDEDEEEDLATVQEVSHFFFGSRFKLLQDEYKLFLILESTFVEKGFITYGVGISREF